MNTDNKNDDVAYIIEKTEGVDGFVEKMKSIKIYNPLSNQEVYAVLKLVGIVIQGRSRSLLPLKEKQISQIFDLVIVAFTECVGY